MLAWQDLSGDPGDLFEFVCDTKTQANLVSNFELVAVQCQYERKHRKEHTHASDSDLEQFLFDEQAVPSPTATSSRAQGVIPAREDRMNGTGPEHNMSPSTRSKRPTPAPPAIKQPDSKETLCSEKAELHLFDFESGVFVEQDASVEATVSELGNWDYWLQISSKHQDWLGSSVIPDLNPVFNYEHRSFIFNYYAEDGSPYSWLLRFKDVETEERFQQGLMQALWEHLNRAKWSKVKDIDRQYAVEAYQDIEMTDAPPIEEEEEEPEEEDEGESDADRKSEHYDSDESQDDVEDQLKSKGKDSNSGLAVGFKNDRSFVMRGSNIGVFKHDGNKLDFQTNINNVSTPKGRTFSPSKAMLHAQDRDMILQNPGDNNSLYRMDLEYGKVVDEYKVHDDIPVKTFAPDSKYAQMTSEPTFIGLSSNALYRIDPRLSGQKMVQDDLKQYASKNKFSAAATTDAGHIAVASDKGDVRMFDRLGVIAKTHIPALGDPISGLDVSADGRWVLATTRTYLLLIDALQKTGKNSGRLGFEKPFGKDDKPQPRRLVLNPAHVAQLTQETRKGISFTPARFNTGEETKETTIATATGPFIVVWSMKKVLQGQKDAYTIKRYGEDVKADDFRYGTDKNLVVALANEVGMERRSALKRPTRDSIVGTPVRGSGIGVTPRKGGRGSGLRNEIVNSPY